MNGVSEMKDALHFKDKVVWITGASSGIGEALAYMLSEAGSNLALSSNEPERLEEVRDKPGGGASPSPPVSGQEFPSVVGRGS